jgi:uncharacterized membrane protein YphA (DoxX/SURF4 family)
MTVAQMMYETLAGAGIPFPHFMTYFGSSVEFIGGCLLVIGLLSSLCSAAFIFDMIVAIITIRLATIKAGASFLDWLDGFLYLPETPYMILLIRLICSGPGRFSVDGRIFRGFEQLARVEDVITEGAVAMLGKMMVDRMARPPTSERAADAIIHRAAKAIEIEDIEARVTELERAAEGQKSGGRS